MIFLWHSKPVLDGSTTWICHTKNKEEKTGSIQGDTSPQSTLQSQKPLFWVIFNQKLKPNMDPAHGPEA
jgi:hypothetical protein